MERLLGSSPRLAPGSAPGKHANCMLWGNRAGVNALASAGSYLRAHESAMGVSRQLEAASG
jgi:hypothetical protein